MKAKENCNKKTDTQYYVGIDVGTDSVGYAVTDSEYNLIKYKGEPMWGASIFEAAELRAERRGFRTARRRLNRRQQRVKLIQELFAEEIGKVDPNFFLRIQESRLFREDKSEPEKYNVFFNDADFSDADYYEKYPTIHHLIAELMNSSEPHDVRLVYIACAWLAAHRGHFLSEVNKENIENILQFDTIYDNFKKVFEENDEKLPWECDTEKFGEILKKKLSITAKEKELITLLFDGKKPKDKGDGYPYNRALLIKLLCGGKVKPAELFFNKEAYEEVASISLGMPDEDFAALLAELEEHEELILSMKAMYDWAVLSDILSGYDSVSQAKIAIYEQHKKDLENLKYFVRKYLPEKYDEVFRKAGKSLKNYAAYAYHYEIKSPKFKAEVKKANKEEFTDYLKKLMKDVKCADEDKAFYDDMMARLETVSFMPKQVNNDNRVIPYQIYWHELNELLKKAKSYLPFLDEKDADGLTPADKILSVFEFRIPYFVGPISNKSDFAWIKRKAESDEKVYPWNFEKKVDLDASEQEFIRRMTNTCTYLPGEHVLPKYSIVYARYEVLNQINKIKVNGEPITVEQKQRIFNELFMNNPRVSSSKLKSYLKSNGIMSSEDVLSGIDTELTTLASLKPLIDFRRIIESGQLSIEDAEAIIEHSTYSEDRNRFKKWINEKYPQLSEENKKYIGSLKYKNFGRLSRKLLCGLNGSSTETGEIGTVMDFLWNTNDNLMQIIASDKYTFDAQIKEMKQEYYGSHGMSLNEMMDSMYISNSVKRPILRTLDIMDDIVKVMGYKPEKVFIEMARGANEDQKNKRTVSRKKQIIELYSKVDGEDVRMLSKQLDELGDNADNKLQSDVLYLYFTQLGRCMYTGKPLDITALKTSMYNVDHIYPQSMVKDDSILNNKVLVLSESNGVKGNAYPVPAEWRNNMVGYWTKLRSNGLITEEKYKRLIRSTPFSDDEKMGFINRQLVETRQSTKALAEIISERYTDNIVYVKAGLVSDFKKKYDIVKCRSINDLHHAKDAYLNIAVGNVYNEKFTKKWFKPGDSYNLKVEAIFGRELVRGENVIWNGQESITKVKNIVKKNNVHFTRYAFCRKGGLFDQMPVKAAEGLVPLKQGLDTAKYGGYNKTAASFFVPVAYSSGKKKDIMIMPVELMYSSRFLADSEYAKEYAKSTVSSIIGKEANDISFPLGKRYLKINTVFSLDGFNVALGSKAGGGKQIGIIPLTPLVVSGDEEKFLKRIERFNEKKKSNSNMKINTEYDGISYESNIILYDMFTKKFMSRPFCCMPNAQGELLKKGKEKFAALSLEEQAAVLLNILSLFKTGRTGTADLECIGGSKNSGVLFLSSNISNWKKNYKEVYIIDTSASGIYEKKSVNLLDLI